MRKSDSVRESEFGTDSRKLVSLSANWRKKFSLCHDPSSVLLVQFFGVRLQAVHGTLYIFDSDYYKLCSSKTIEMAPYLGTTSSAFPLVCSFLRQITHYDNYLKKNLLN